MSNNPKDQNKPDEQILGNSISLAMKDMVKSRDKLQRTQLLAGIGGFEYLPDEKLIIISDEACAVLGVCEGRNSYEIKEFCASIKKGGSSKFCEMLEQANSNTLDNIEFVFKDSSGEVRYIEVIVDQPESTIQGSISGVFRNITRTKKAELERAASSQAFSLVFDNSKIAILVINLKGYIIGFNKSALDLLEYTEEEMDKMHSSKLVHPEDVIEASKMFARFITSAGKINSLDYRVLAKSGRLIDVLVNFDMVIDPSGEKIYVFLNDITKIKEMESKNIDQERMLIQQSKMATLGEMVALLAHQWQQPLNSIGMTVQMLDELISVDEENRKLLVKSVENVMDQVSMMSDTMDDFRDFLQPSGDKTKFNLLKTLNDVVTLYRPQLRFYEIGCEIHFEDESIGSIEVEGYSNELKNVILNFLTNSRDAIVKSRGVKGDIQVIIKDDGDKVHVIIEDNGGGMPECMLKDIFTPYVSSKGSKGTGLGLYMAKLIIKDRMHGDISVCNSDEGLRVSIWLNKCADE